MFGLFGKKIEEILGDGDYETKIVGVTHYQKNLKTVFKKLRDEEYGWFFTKATLRPDNKNKYDVNALEFRDDFSDKSNAKTFEVDCKLKQVSNGNIIGLLDIRDNW